MISLKEHYSDKVLPELKQVMGLTSDMGVPKITKVTINMGVGAVSYTHLTLPTKA